MLYECNHPRLLMIKYSPLAGVLVILFGFIPQVVRDHGYAWPDILVCVAFPITIAILLIILFLYLYNKLRYVAIGKSKIIIRKKGQEVEYNWLDVERLTLNRFFGLYKLTIKNEDAIYFTPYGTTTWLTGDDSDMGVIINKMKSELQI